jgi:hypothetical protein
VTRVEALAAIRAELAPAVALALEGAPPDLVDELVGLVAGGPCSATEAAEALTFAIELADATERGELDDRHGQELMARLAYRQRGDVDPD